MSLQALQLSLGDARSWQRSQAPFLGPPCLARSHYHPKLSSGSRVPSDLYNSNQPSGGRQKAGGPPGPLQQ